MKKEFRYKAIAASGKAVQGIVMAENKKEAQTMTSNLAKRYNFRVNSIQPKKAFLYYVKLPNGNKIKGRQSAYSKLELQTALATIGYKEAKIEPVLLDIKLKPPATNIIMFVNLASFLLKEKMGFDKILRMLADDEANPVLKETLKNIESELKKGKEGVEVFSKYEWVFGKFPAYMLGLATKSGNMADVYDATSKFMERDMEYKKKVKQAMVMPMVTVLLMNGALVYYVVDIFPATARLFVKYGMDIPPLTKGTLAASDFLAIHWWWMLLIVMIPIIATLVWWSTPNGRVWRDKHMIKLPVIGHLLHKSSIEIFFRVFSAIYAGADNNIETIQASAEACRNAYIERGIKTITIPLMLKDGLSLVPALQKAEVFNRTTLNRIRAGTESGNILQSARQIASYYEKETTYKMDSLIQSIEVFIAMYIFVILIFLTVVSSEIAMISPPTGM